MRRELQSGCSSGMGWDEWTVAELILLRSMICPGDFTNGDQAGV
jgi:hypothetical protein